MHTMGRTVTAQHPFETMNSEAEASHQTLLQGKAFPKICALEEGLQKPVSLLFLCA